VNDFDDDFGVLIPGISGDLGNQIDAWFRDTDNKLASERMRWPNPNLPDHIQKLWDHYVDAYGRHVFGYDKTTPSGASTADEMMYWWEQYKNAVIEEYYHTDEDGYSNDD
jgi:hypothetical protein